MSYQPCKPEADAARIAALDNPAAGLSDERLADRLRGVAARPHLYTAVERERTLLAAADRLDRR